MPGNERAGFPENSNPAEQPAVSPRVLGQEWQSEGHMAESADTVYVLSFAKTTARRFASKSESVTLAT